VIGNENATRPLAATFFWQAFLGTNAFQEVLSAAQATGTIETFVVLHTNGTRYDLLVFDDNPLRNVPFIQRVDVSSSELDIGWDRFAQGLVSRGWDDKRALRGRPPPNEVAKEVRVVRTFNVMVMRRPPVERTAARPTVATSVDDASATPRATLGIIATNQAGIIGATTALHAVAGLPSLSISKAPAMVISSEVLSDSCFLQSAAISMPPSHVEGPMTGLVPRQYQNVEFEGIKSGRVSTTVTAWSPQLPNVFKGAQLAVLTRPDTAPGDSGAALYENAQGGPTILGFAQYRTAYGAMNAFSAWIWAECVFLAHNLS